MRYLMALRKLGDSFAVIPKSDPEVALKNATYFAWGNSVVKGKTTTAII